jgi:hypothetical protein
MLRRVVLAVLCLLLVGPAWPASAALAGWWQFDETSPKAGAAGMLYFDDIGYGHPVK